MKTKFNQKNIKKNRVKKYGIAHLSAGEAKVPSVSAFTVGEFTIEPKKIEEKNNVQISSIGSEAEVTDYAILMGAEYFESDDMRRMGSYWTNTPVESKTPLNICDGPRKITAYKLNEVKPLYTFYGYSKGEEIDKIVDPCIIEIVDETGTTLCINKDGRMWTLKEKTSYYAEATMGACMSGPRINETISSLTIDRHLGYSSDFLRKLQRRLEERKFWINLCSGKYHYVAGNNNSDIREVSDTSVGIRPIFNTYNHSSINVPELDGVKMADAMDFPQTIATRKEQKELKKLLKNNQLNKTGRYFPTSNEGLVEEYEYNGKKYVRVTATFFDKESKTLLSNGCEYKYGSKVWVKVEPVKLIVTKDNFSSLTEKILFAGVPYNQTIIQDAITCLRSSTFIEFLLSNAEDFFFTTGTSLYDKIVTGTDWMKSYQYTKDKYAEFNIPFEETELEASERYKKEYEKLEEYCKKYRLDMQFDEFNKNVRQRTIDYSYRPSVEFLNSLGDPITSTLAALGPRDIWNRQFFEEYLKAYGLWALLTLKEENINQISNKMYDEKLEKVLKLDFQPIHQEQSGPVKKLTTPKK
ncbi:MAG: hypothetical protein IJ399_02875 [Bacilli bacterium]|nr:hypothetical protein [Bacilli bacterium]